MEIKYIKDVNEEKVLPVTSTKAVRDEQGTALDDTLNEIKENADTEHAKVNDVDTRLKVVEELAEISVDGGEIGIATAEDFHSEDPEALAKVPTVNAIKQSMDDEPTAGSDNLVKSGGVKNELALGAVYDVSAKNPTAGPNNDGKFESLSALLSDVNLNTLIPTSVRKGGMSIKFVQSSDNKYVQFRLMHTLSNASTADADFANVDNWQGVDDEIAPGSQNLITNNAAFNGLDTRCIILVGEGSWQTIGKTDWKVGDRFFQYFTLNSITAGYIRTVKAVTNNGATVYSISSPDVLAPQNALYVVNGYFYTYKGGESLVRLTDIQDILTLIGSLSSLNTTAKTSIVAAVNEVLSYIGDISLLTTSAKTSIVEAINEVVGTTIGALSGLKTTDKTSIVSAINELANKFIETTSISQTVRENKYWNTKPGSSSLAVGDSFDGNSKNGSGWYSVEKLFVQEGELYKYYGIGNNNAAYKTYVITDSSDKVLVISSLANNSDYRTTPLDIVIPVNGTNMYVNFGNSYDSTSDKLVKYTEQEIDFVQMQEDIDDLKLDVNDLKLDVNDLKKLPLYGKTIVCFGDSITEFSKTGGKTYSEYLAEFCGATVINVGVGGTRLAQRTTPVTTPTTNLEAMAACDIVNMVKAACEQDFTKQVNAMQWEYDNNHYDKRDIITRLQGIDWSAVDIVIILGGTNDWQSAHTFGTTGYTDFDVNTTIGAMNYMLRLLTYTYPHLDVYFGVGTYQYKDDDFEKSFSGTRTFEVGEDTIYQGRLYKFISAHSAGAWNPSEVRLLTDTELYNLSSDVIEFGTKTKREFNELLLGEAKLSSVTLLDMYNNIWNAYNYTTALMADLTHPLNGNDKLGKWVLSQILGNYKSCSA